MPTPVCNTTDHIYYLQDLYCFLDLLAIGTRFIDDPQQSFYILFDYECYLVGIQRHLACHLMAAKP